MTDVLEAALDELYAARPEDFVATRTALGKKHGKKIAAALKARRKPTQTAYALNQLARQSPDAIADLVDAGRALARAQRKAMRGDAAVVREAIARQRTVIRERMDEVAKLVAKLGIDAARLPEIASALQAALVDPAIGEALEAGRLEKPPEAPTGFPLVAGPAPAPAPAPSSERAGEKAAKRAEAARKKQAAEEKKKALAAARHEAEAEATRLETIARELAREATNAVRAAEHAAKIAAAARKAAGAVGA